MMNRGTRSIALVAVTAFAVMLSASARAQPREENGRYRLAQGYEASGDMKNAARVYQELYANDPASNVYFDGVRRTFIALARYGDLLPIVEERVARLPRDVALRVGYADLLARMGKRDDATREWRAAVDLFPDDRSAYTMVATSQIEQKQFELAVGTYRLGRSRLGDPGAFGEQLAPVLAALGRFAEASEEYLALLDVDATRLSYVMSGMGSYTANPDGADAAIRIVRDRLGSRPDQLPYLDLLSWLYAERGDYDGAFDVVRRLDSARRGRGSDIYAFADLCIRERKYDAAIRAAEYFQATYPHSNALHPGIMLIYTAGLEGRYRALPTRGAADAEALAKRYQAIAHDEPTAAAAPQALLNAARIEAEDLNEPKEAIALLDDIAERYPRFPGIGEALLLRADLYLRIGNLDRARQLYAAGAERPAYDDDADKVRDQFGLRRAEMLFFDGKFADATKAFAALADNTGSEAANDALAYQFLLQEDAERHTDALRHYAAGMLSMRRLDWAAAAEELDRAVALGRDASLADEALFARATAQSMLGQDREAVATLLALVKEYADGTTADRALFRAAELTERKLSDRGKAMELYGRVLTEYGASAYAEPARERIRALRGD